MPAIGFICPDGQKIRFADCLKKRGCRHLVNDRRCLTLGTLKRMALQRVWKGKPSVTGCIKGTMQAFLENTVDYYFDPQKKMFALAGTLHHGKMEDIMKGSNALTEEAFEEDITGIPDLLQPDEYSDVTDAFGFMSPHELIDYKNWGSFQAMKILGIWKEDVKTGEFYKSGARKGQAKTRKEIRQDDEHKDLFDTTMQLNRYRQFYERAGFNITKLSVQITVRDGGILAAKSRGVTKNGLYQDTPIPIISDNEVDMYFHNKRDALVEAMKTGKEPDICAPRERWDNDKKCKRFCPVNFACWHGRQFVEGKEG